MADKIAEWKVNETENFSDHNTITFKIKTPTPEVQYKRNYAELDTDRFRERLEELSGDWATPETWTLEEIENQERKSNELITRVLDELIPLKEVKLLRTG